jgi:predicted RNA binding protein YcfA (HicA-like mRNA interferase family)
VDRLPALSGREVVRLLQRAGFRVVSQRASHVKMRRGDSVAIVPVHGNRPLKRATLMGIFKDAGLTLEEVWGLLK